VKIDIYTKVILTIIAICLLGSLIKPIIFPKKATAWQESILDVNIERISGRYIELAPPIRVEVVR